MYANSLIVWVMLLINENIFGYFVHNFPVASRMYSSHDYVYHRTTCGVPAEVFVNILSNSFTISITKVIEFNGAVAFMDIDFMLSLLLKLFSLYSKALNDRITMDFCVRRSTTPPRKKTPIWDFVACFQSQEVFCFVGPRHGHFYTNMILIFLRQIPQIKRLYIHACRSKKHQSSASLAFVRGINRWPMNSPHKWPVTRKIFPFDDVIM